MARSWRARRGVRYAFQRTREVLVFSAVVGAATGLGVALFDHLAIDVLLRWLRQLPVPIAAAGPFVGLVIAALALRFMADGASPSTSDEYIKAFHHKGRFPLKPAWGRITASLSTLGLGGTLGLEGPAMYIGASIGHWLQRTFHRFVFDPSLLMVAGAAAGVSAVFKTPATGAIFALEVPYRNDLGRHMLLPALVGSATGYLAFVPFRGTNPLLEVSGQPPFDLRDLLGAILVGLGAGLGARSFAFVMLGVKRVAQRLAPATRVVVAGAGLYAVTIAAETFSDGLLAIGPGYDALLWGLVNDRSLWLIAALLALRTLSTAFTVGGGGAGGLFVPLVVAGGLLGRIIGGLVSELDSSLFTMIGMAAFVGAGYRVPLASVMFVAEATGRPGFVVPGLLAAVTADLVMGDESVCPYQLRGVEI